MTVKHDTSAPQVAWDLGTAYDMFASLQVLHFPAHFGLRGAWAAGVRSRLSVDERDFLEKAMELLKSPLPWIYRLPPPKDGTTVLYALKQIPPEQRLAQLTLGAGEMNSDYGRLVLDVAARGSWVEKDRAALLDIFRQHKEKFSPKKAEVVLDLWSRPTEVGEQLLAVLQTYHQVFFAEEEKRILPALERALHSAQGLAQKLSVPELLEELTRGLIFTELSGVHEVVLAPSFWTTPLVIHNELAPGSTIWLFGARGPEDSLVPGESVPDELLLALKALADPTRLRILRYLANEHLTPAELSRRLRLRAPTVTHHLHALRLAGLVRFTAKSKNERLYSARFERVAAAYANLKAFLETQVSEESEGEEEFARGQVW